MIVVLKGLISEFDISVKKNIAFLRADDSSRFQLSSHTAARSGYHSLRPQTDVPHVLKFLYVLTCNIYRITQVYTQYTHHVPLVASFLWLGVSAHHTYWLYHDVCIMPYILFKIILHAFAP